MKINTPSRWGILFACLCFVLSGCGYATAYVPQALRLGASVADTLEHTDVDAAVSPGCTKEDFEKIKKVVVIFKESPHDFARIADAVADRLTIELMKLGLEVVEQQRLDNVVAQWRMQYKDFDDYNLNKMGKTLGVDAVVTGSVTSVMKFHHGIMGIGGGRTHAVQNASLKIIGCKKGRTMMVVTVDYKKGQKPRDAAKAMAVILKDKLQNPFG